MLKKLIIRNYILIDELDIHFNQGLSIITGETGAGKSIILGALGMISGLRADSSLLLNKEKKCIIEAVFDIACYQLEDFFRKNELDYEMETCIRRELTPEGKSRSFINDTPVNLAVIKELTSGLLDIHSQHESLLLADSKFQMRVLDARAANSKLKSAYKSAYDEVKAITRELQTLKERESQSKADLDYYNFQLNELSSLKLQPGEQELLEQEQARLEHGEEILKCLEFASSTLRGAENNVVAQLVQVQQGLNTVKEYDDQLNQQMERLQTAIIELKDIHGELEHASLKFQLDPSGLEHIQERLSMIYQLQKKHRVNTIDELLSLQKSLEEKVAGIGFLDDQIINLNKRLVIASGALQNSGEALSASRKKAIAPMEVEITRQLSELSMPHAVFKINLIRDKDDSFLPDGLEKVQYLFSANKGVDFKELSRVASGGEMSRLLLCIKAMLANLSAMPTVIFDEIDTGISGETASRVGNILKQMAKEHQVLAITHLPQIASKGDEHFLVYKEVKKGQTRSFLKKLEEQERIQEIARMLSGEELSEAALENAKDLLSQ